MWSIIFLFYLFYFLGCELSWKLILTLTHLSTFSPQRDSVGVCGCQSCRQPPPDMRVLSNQSMVRGSCDNCHHWDVPEDYNLSSRSKLAFRLHYRFSRQPHYLPEMLAASTRHGSTDQPGHEQGRVTTNSTTSHNLINPTFWKFKSNQSSSLHYSTVWYKGVLSRLGQWVEGGSWLVLELELDK